MAHITISTAADVSQKGLTDVNRVAIGFLRDTGTR